MTSTVQLPPNYSHCELPFAGDVLMLVMCVCVWCVTFLYALVKAIRCICGGADEERFLPITQCASGLELNNSIKKS